MIDKSNLEDRIKKDLMSRAAEFNPSEEVFHKIAHRINDYEGENKGMKRGRLYSISIKKCMAVSLCAVFAITGTLLAFSGEARAFAMDTIKSIFVLEKSQDEYKVLEKSDTEAVFYPTFGHGTELNDAQLSKKMGFKVFFPQSLQGGYEYYDTTEIIGINVKVSAETMASLEKTAMKAVDDEAVFESMSKYEPYRAVSATYKGRDGKPVFLNMADSRIEIKSSVQTVVGITKVGSAEAKWIETANPDYEIITENGVGKYDLYAKPEGTVSKHVLVWTSNGVSYRLNTLNHQDINLEEAVRIAESFMEKQVQ